MNFGINNFNLKSSVLSKIVFAVVLFFMLVTTCFLYVEYNFFKKQSESMIGLQEDYRTYISAVNKILVDYNRVKEELEQKSSDMSDKPDQKKKDDELASKLFGPKSACSGSLALNGLRKKILAKNEFDDIYFDQKFPKYVVVSSSDNVQSESFCLVNRDLKHLREGAINYLKGYCKSKGLPLRICPSDYMDYTDCSLERIAQANKILIRARHARLRAKRLKSSYKYGYRGKKFGRNHRGPKKVSSYNGDGGNSHENSSRSDIRLSWPIDKNSFYFSSLYGPRRKRSGRWGFHYGVDMAAMKGTPVHAASSGIVVEARNRHGYGNTVVIAHSRKYRTRYAHLNKIFVSVGHKIGIGGLVGAVGNTGFVRSMHGDGSHLHFEVIENGRKINPLPFIA